MAFRLRAFARSGLLGLLGFGVRDQVCRCVAVHRGAALLCGRRAQGFVRRKKGLAGSTGPRIFRVGMHAAGWGSMISGFLDVGQRGLQCGLREAKEKPAKLLPPPMGRVVSPRKASARAASSRAPSQARASPGIGFGSRVMSLRELGGRPRSAPWTRSEPETPTPNRSPTLSLTSCVRRDAHACLLGSTPRWPHAKS